MRYLLGSLPGTEVVVLALLPRGHGALTQPSIFTAAINAANSKYR